MSHPARPLSRFSFLVAAFALLVAPRAPAQTTITYTNGQTNSTVIDTSPPNSPTTLALTTGAATQSGVISGTGGLTKTGAGTLNLTNTNTYTGTTTVSAGTLAFNLAPVGNIVNNDSLSILAAAGNYGGVISGTGSVTLGTLTLSGANTYAGPTNILPGSFVQIAASDRLPTGTALTIGFDGALVLQSYNQTLGSLAGSGDVYLDSGTLTVGSDNTSTTFSGGLKRYGSTSGSFVKTGTGTLFFSLPTGNSVPRSSFDGTITINGGLINFAALGDFGNSPSTITLNGGGLQWATGSTADPSAKFTPLGANGGTFDTNGNNVTLASALSGTGGLTKAGLGTLTLNATNTYSGGTTVTGGLVHFSSLATLGSGTVTLNGGGLRWATGNTDDVSNRLAALGANGGTFDTNGNNITFASALSGSGALVKTGSGTLTLNNANTYSGGTRVTGGLVNFSNLANFGSGTVTLNGGGLQWATGNTLDITNRLAPLGANGGTFDTNGNNVTFASALTGPGGFTKAGLGNLTLSVPNTYTGPTAMTRGTLTLGANDVLPDTSAVNIFNTTLNLAGFSDTIGSLAGSGNITLGSGTLTIGADNSSTTSSALISGTGGLTKIGSGTQTLGNFNTYTGTTTVSAGTLAFDFAPVGNIVNHAALKIVNAPDYGGVISGTGSVTLGYVTLSGAHTYTGPTNLLPTGHVLLTASDRLPTGTALTLGSDSFFYLQSYNQTLGSLAGSGDVYLDTGTLTVGSDNTSTTFSGDLKQTGSTGGSFVKTGTGTLFFSLQTGNFFPRSSFTGNINITGGLINFTNTADFSTSLSTITLNGGGLQWATGSTANPSSKFTPLGANGATFDTNGNNVTFTSGLSGAGGVTKTGTGTLTLGGGNTYSGITTISAGTLVLGGGDSLSGNIVNNAALIFGGTANSTYSGAISGPGSITKSGSGTTTLTGDVYNIGPQGNFTIASGALRLTDQTGFFFYDLINNGTVIFDQNTNKTFTQLITGTGSVIKTGSGTFTLTRPNTYSGGTTISAGTLAITNSSSNTALGTGPIAIITGGDLTATQSLTLDSSLSVDGSGSSFTTSSSLGLRSTSSITNGGSLTSGSLTLGALGIDPPTLTVTGANSVLHVNGQIDLFNGAALSITDSATLRVGGGDGIRSFGGAPLNLSGSTLQVTGSDLTSAILATLTGTATLNTNGLNATLSGVLSGTGALTKTGNGTLALTASNTYTGGTTLTGGLVNFSSLANFGTGSVTLDGGGVQWATGTSTDLSPRLAALGAGGGTFDTNGNAVTFATALSGLGGLTKSGAGTLTLAAANTYTGPTTVTAGTLAFGANQAIPATSAVTVGVGSTLDLASFSATLNSLGGTGTVSLGSGTLTTGGANSATWAGVFSGTGSLIKTGTGALTLTGANTLSGATTVSAGTLILANGATLGAVVNNAALIFDRTDTSTFSGAISGPGTLTKTGSGTVTLSGVNTYSGTTTVTAGTLAVATVANLGTGSVAVVSGGRLDGGSANLSFNRSVSVDGPGSTLATTGYLEFGHPGAGSLTLTGGATASATASIAFGVNFGTGTGSVTGTGSTLTTNHLFLGALGGTGTLSLGDGGTATVNSVRFGVGGGTGTLHLNSGGTLRIGGADGIRNEGGTATVNLAGGTLQVNGSALTTSVPATLTGTSTIHTNGLAATFSGVLSGTGALTKSGAGALTLLGTHTFTGPTAVDAGSLLINGAVASSAVAVTSGATLGGTGTLGGLATLNAGAHLAPGNSPGTLTFTAGLTLLASSILDFELGSTSDLIRVAGGTLTGPTSGFITLNLTDTGSFTAGTYTLFDYTSAATTSFEPTDFTFGTTIPGYTYALALAGSTLQLTATASAIPEPSTYAALFGAAALALACYRRRQNARG